MADLAGGTIAMNITSMFDRSSFNSVISDLTSQFSKASDDIGKSFGQNLGKGTSSSMTSMSASIEQQMRSAQSAVESSMQGMVKATNSVILALGNVDATAKKVSETVAKYGDDSSQASKAVVAHTKEQQNLAQANTDVTKATSAQIDATNALTDVQAKSTKAHDDATKSTSALGAAATTAGLAITAGFVGAVGVAIDQAANFQTTQTRLVTSAGLAQTALKGVSDGILQMAGQVGVSAQDLSTAMYTVSSGMTHVADPAKDAANALDILKAAAQGAKQEGADVKTVADAVTTTLKDYYEPAADAATVTSQLVTAVSQGKTTMEEFTGSLHSITPLASEAGVSLADVTGSLAEMTSHGMSADQASQNLADTLRHMITPTNQMRDELAQIGMTTGNLQTSLSSQGLAGTLETLSQKILTQMGPSGTMLLNSFNSSKDAAANLQQVIKSMPPDLQNITTQFENGQMSATAYRKATGALPGNMQDLAKGFLSAWDKADGFTSAIKNGSPQAQTYTQAIKAITGDATGLNTTLMLTGKNFGDTSNNIKLVTGATQDASGNVKGWDDIQGTFNQKMAEFKASIGATAISLGNDFLPAATSVAKILADVGTWLTKNKGFLDTLVISVGAAAGAFVVFKTVSAMWTVLNLGIEGAAAAMGLFSTAEDVATVSSGGLAAALAATGISEIALGIAGLVAAIAALAAGVIYAYDHWKLFHDAVQDVWTVLKAVGEWIAGAAVDAWHVLEKAIDPVADAFKAVADAAMWLWHNVIEPVADGISLALRTVGAIVLTVLAVPFVLAFKLIEAAVDFLYQNVIKPTFNDLQIIFQWLYANVIQPTVDLIKIEIQAFGDIITWLNTTIIQPIFAAIGDVWHWLHDTIIKPIIDLIQTEIQAWGAAFTWLHDTIIKPVGDAIGTVMDGLKTAFKDVVDWLETQWGRIEGIVGPPVTFIIDTVYNQGIVPVWNAVAGVFGMDQIQPIGDSGLGVSAGGGTPSASAGGNAPAASGGAGGSGNFAGGGVWQGPGVLPGYAPGKDSLRAVLSPGEGVAVPELVQAIGPQRFMALNAAYSNGRTPGSGPGFDAGGVIGDIVDAGKSAVSGAVDTAKFMAQLATDPDGAVRQLFSSVTGHANATPGDPSAWLSAIKTLPDKVVSAVIDKAKSWLSLGGGSGGTAGNEAWVSGAGATQWAPLIIQALQLEGFPTTPDYVNAAEAQIMTESGGNPNIVQQIQDQNSGANEARGLVQVTPQTAAGLGLATLGGNIYDPLTNLRLGLRELKSQHGGDLLGTWGHGHGYAGGGIAPETAKPKTTKKKPPDETAINRAAAWLQTVVGGAYQYGTALDCSGFMSGIYESLIGGNAAQRAFTTISDFTSLGFSKGTGGIFSIGVKPLAGEDGHMAGTFNGHNVESSSDHGIAMDGAARGATDSMFSAQYYLPGSKFSPPYTGTGSKATPAQTADNKLNTDVAKYQKQAQTATDDANKALAEAQKHDQDAQKYLDDVKTAKTPKAIADYQARAKTAQAAAQKSRDDATKDQQKAADATAKANQAQQDAQAQSSDTSSTDSSSTDSSSSDTSTSSDASSSMTGVLTFEQLGEKLGGAGADAITETFGLDNISSIISNSRILKVGNAVANAKVGAPYLDQFFALPKKTDTTPKASTPKAPSLAPTDQKNQKNPLTAQVFDDGGWLEPGGIALNLGSRPEPILKPQQADHLQQMAQGGSGTPKAWVNIENITHVGGNESQTARRIVREMNTYQPRGAR